MLSPSLIAFPLHPAIVSDFAVNKDIHYFPPCWRPCFTFEYDPNRRLQIEDAIQFIADLFNIFPQPQRHGGIILESLRDVVQRCGLVVLNEKPEPYHKCLQLLTIWTARELRLSSPFG